MYNIYIHTCIYIYIYMCIYTHICIYIYIEREREIHTVRGGNSALELDKHIISGFDLFVKMRRVWLMNKSIGTLIPVTVAVLEHSILASQTTSDDQTSVFIYLDFLLDLIRLILVIQPITNSYLCVFIYHHMPGHCKRALEAKPWARF